MASLASILDVKTLKALRHIGIGDSLQNDYVANGLNLALQTLLHSNADATNNGTAS